MTFSIDNFWAARLSAPARGENGGPRGWKHVESGLSTFLEAPLCVGSGYDDSDPYASQIILVSAPGAVGKSTLARQIAYRTGAMLLDLAEADPVGANTLVGGLARTSLYTPFLEGSASLIVDGLDEALMTVPQKNFAAFLDDVVTLTDQHRKPLVLLGRMGAVDESWLWLKEKGRESAVLEIQYYGKDASAEFAKIQAQHIRKEKERREPDGRAIDLILSKIKDDLGPDGDRFTGYSPVLIAISKQVADPADRDNKNTQALISHIEQGRYVMNLADVSRSILEREQEKIKRINFSNPHLHQELYTPEEQIARLIAKIYQKGPNPKLPTMSPQDQEIYDRALANWVSEHPFLDGTGQRPSSDVFGGLLVARALLTESISGIALNREIERSAKVNPFIHEFYFSESENRNGNPFVIPEHLGILYASYCARLSQGETAHLRVDGEIDRRCRG